MALKEIAMVGSRTFTDYKRFCHWVDMHYPCIVISGGAQGADSLAARWAKELDLQTIIYLADWNLFGHSAGFRRNKQIVEAADMVIAFWDWKSKGTRSTIELAIAAGKPVFAIHTTESKFAVNKSILTA